MWVNVACPLARDVNDMSEKGGGVPADFVAVAVVRCRTEIRTVPGEGTWAVRITERTDAPSPELVDILRRPSDPPPRRGLLCTAVAYQVPYFLLVDASGKAILPAVPRDVCGNPRMEVGNFLDTLTYRRLDETRVGLSRPEDQSGCLDVRKDRIEIEFPRSAPAASVWHGENYLLVCLYTVTGDTGRLDAGHTLAGEEVSALAKALSGAGRAAVCDRPHTRFAVLSSGNGLEGAVELDGCLRFLRPDGTLGQLSSDMVGTLTT